MILENISQGATTSLSTQVNAGKPGNLSNHSCWCLQEELKFSGCEVATGAWWRQECDFLSCSEGVVLLPLSIANYNIICSCWIACLRDVSFDSLPLTNPPESLVGACDVERISFRARLVLLRPLLQVEELVKICGPEDWVFSQCRSALRDRVFRMRGASQDRSAWLVHQAMAPTQIQLYTA